MYKTVRHGENSLQYTILPQTEEVLNNSGIKGKGRDYSPSIHIRRTRRRSTVKYVLLVTFGLIVALTVAAIPIYIMNGVIFSRRNLERHEPSAPLTPTGREIVKSRNMELKEMLSTLKLRHDINTTPTAPTTTMKTKTTTVKVEKTSIPPWNVAVVLKSWKSSKFSSTIQTIPTEGTETVPIVTTSTTNQQKNRSSASWDKDVVMRPTATPQPTIAQRILSISTVRPTTNKLEKVLITSKPTIQLTAIQSTENTKFKDLKDTILSVDDDDDFKESLEVDEVFSIPPMKDDEDCDSDEVTVSKAGDATWYGARWPFVDTSSYFQWTGYSPDNLLVPLLFGALSSLVLVSLLALGVWRRKRTATAFGLAAEIHVDDSTNLLSENENVEDGEE